jgi:hypothetical protein
MDTFKGVEMNQRKKDEDERIATEPNRLRKTESQEKGKTVGTFAGEEDQVVRTREGEPVPQDTGDQGGGQN